MLMSMKEYEKIDLSLERLVICVVSTTGQGDPPDNASKFFKFIKGRSNAPTMLAAWRFCVLGLGDTNYDMFCKPGKVLDKRLEELGAQRFVTGATGLKGEHGGPNGAADDAEGGQEECIEPWVKHLLSTMDMTGYTGPASKRARVENACTAPPDTAPPPPAQIASTTAANQASAGSLNEPSLAALPSEKLHMFQDVTGAWKQVAGLEGILKAKYGLLPKPTTPCMCLVDADPALKTRDGGAACDSLQPRFLALITAWRYLTTPASTDRVVVEVEFDVSQGDWAYAPGDSIGIDCCNSLADVDALLSHLGYDPLHRVTVSGSQSDAAGKGAGPPQHLVSDGAVTLRDLVAWRVDIRSQPKKALIRLLADHCGVEAEADDLYLLSSIKGRDRFRAEIEEESVSIIELLKRYPSARPPLAVLLQVMSYFTFFCCCFLLMVELLTRCTPPARTLFCFSRGH
jgi:methionine synthase reductase